MTEDEAKTKWCAFANSRIVTLRVNEELIENATFATDLSTLGNKIPSTLCIGCACMAWRWKDVPVLIDRETHKQLPITGPITYDGSKFYTEDVPSDTHGYCGLAGKP